MQSSDVLAGLVGIMAGEGIADTLVDDDNILGHVVTGVLGSAVIGSLTKTVVEETGIGDVLDDLLGF